MQSALSIPNEATAAWRADNNTAHQANATFQAGASAPGTTYSDQYWYDTTAQVLKKRNQANSVWIVIGTRDEAFTVARSSNTILGLSDVGKHFVATSTFTQTLTAAATLGDGWYCFYRNDGVGAITFDPNASETIDGLPTMVLQSGESVRIACNGSAFKTQGRAGQGTIVKRKTADETVTNSTTLQDDDHLIFPIGANEEWIAELELSVNDSAFVAGAKFAFTVPAGATMEFDQSFITGPTNNTGISGRSSSSGVAAGGTGWGGDAMIRGMLWVLNGATPGNVTLQWAQMSASPGVSTVVRKGSSLTARRVA